MVHATRRRTGSFIRRPRHYMDDYDSPDLQQSQSHLATASSTPRGHAGLRTSSSAVPSASINLKLYEDNGKSGTPPVVVLPIVDSAQSPAVINSKSISPSPASTTTLNPHATRARRNSMSRQMMMASEHSQQQSSSITTSITSVIDDSVSTPRLEPESGTVPSSLGSNHDSETTTTSVAAATPVVSNSNNMNSNAMMKGPVPLFPFSDAYVPQPVDDKRHPRELVPSDIGFPPPDLQHMVRKQDLDDKLLMATCAVLHSHENRALCPKEIAEVMFQRGWLHNAGTTPFAHISTCIRAHLRRAGTSVPPYAPILTSFELVGALPPAEIAAVGLKADDRPAVKRGTLWYLDERVFGSGVGADDPFSRCRRVATGSDGVANSSEQLAATAVSRSGPVPILPAVPPAVTTPEEGDDLDGGMGRGKRKRRASHAAIAALGVELGMSPTGVVVPVTSAVTSHHGTRSSSASISFGHRRTQSLGGSAATPVLSSTGLARSGVPRLRLRLAALEEVDSGVDDSDGFTSDAARRRSRNKKKVRRATSAGNSRAGSAGYEDEEDDLEVEHEVMGDDDEEFGDADEGDDSDEEVEDDDDDDMRSTRHGSSAPVERKPGKYSSATSSALLAQSLLAASSSPNLIAPQTGSNSPRTSAVSPDSLALDPLAHYGTKKHSTNPQHITASASAPNLSLFSSFRSARSPEVMDVDEEQNPCSALDPPHTTSNRSIDALKADLEDDGDFHEAMLRGEDFDFEWGSESYTVAGDGDGDDSLHKSMVSLKAPSREMSVGVPEAFDIKDDFDALSTPATTPRSPLEDSEILACPPAANASAAAAAAAAGASAFGMESTLCEALADQVERPEAVVEDQRLLTEPATFDRANSTESLTSLVEEDGLLPERTVPPSSPLAADASAIPAPLPSPLVLDMSNRLPFNADLATDYDFVGRDEDDERALLFQRVSQYSRDMAEAADDEDDEEIGEDDDDDDGDDEGELSNFAREREQSIDRVRIKVEDEAVGDSPFMTLPVDRTLPTRPYGEPYSRRFVRESSPCSSGSDSDVFDASAVLSRPPNGFTGSFSAASPAQQLSPLDTTDWTLHFDLDELDTDIGNGADLLGPETVALEELDLAWADEQGEDETDDEWRARQVEHAKATSAAAAAFLTAGPACMGTLERLLLSNANKSPKSRFASPVSARTLTPVVTPLSPPVKRSYSSQSIGRRGFGSSHTSRSSSVSPLAVQPKVPLSVPVTVTAIENGLAVYAAEVVLHDTATTATLLRRVDTDYVNGSVLLRVTFADKAERDAQLRSISGAHEVEAESASDGDGVAGTWIPLRAAQRLVSGSSSEDDDQGYGPALAHLRAFVADDLARAFPSSVMELRDGLKCAAAAVARRTVECPLFDGTASYFDDAEPTACTLPMI